MMAVDTSALMAILLREEQADGCRQALEAENELLISAGTVAEALIVARRRRIGDEMRQLLEGLGFDIVSVTPMAAKRIGIAYQKWGKGIDKAGLNFGDCFSYDVAKQYACPLLFVGDDFRKTDIESML